MHLHSILHNISIGVVHYLSLSLLTWPPCIAIIINIGGWSPLTGSEASGALGTVPSGLCATLYLSSTRPPSKRLWFFYHIIPSPSSPPPLPYSPSPSDSSVPVFPPPPLLHAPPLSPGYPGWATPTTVWIGIHDIIYAL